MPNQALHLYNSPFVVRTGGKIRRSLDEKSARMDAQIRAAWNHAFSRDPSPEEVENAEAFLVGAEYDLKSQQTAWASLCQALLVANEFRYVD